MIKASRIWIACEERIEYMRSQVPSLWTCSPRSLGLPSKLLNAFLFPLTNHAQIFRGLLSLSSSHWPGSFKIRWFTLVQHYLLYLLVLPIYLVSDKFEYMSSSWGQTTNYSPLHFFPFCSICILLLSPHPNTHTFPTFTVCFWDCSSAHFSNTLWSLLMQSRETRVRLCLISLCSGLTRAESNLMGLSVWRDGNSMVVVQCQWPFSGQSCSFSIPGFVPRPHFCVTVPATSSEFTLIPSMCMYDWNCLYVYVHFVDFGALWFLKNSQCL